MQEVAGVLDDSHTQYVRLNAVRLFNMLFVLFVVAEHNSFLVLRNEQIQLLDKKPRPQHQLVLLPFQRRNYRRQVIRLSEVAREQLLVYEEVLVLRNGLNDIERDLNEVADCRLLELLYFPVVLDEQRAARCVLHRR